MADICDVIEGVAPEGHIHVVTFASVRALNFDKLLDKVVLAIRWTAGVECALREDTSWVGMSCIFQSAATVNEQKMDGLHSGARHNIAGLQCPL